jgi:hypothetical protein
MIKIQSYGSSPGWYQVDTSYNQPSITGAVQWNGNTKCFEVNNGSTWQRIDNTVQINNSSAYDINVIGAWAMKKMQEEEETKKLRSKYPALDEAYNHLDLIKALVTSGTEENSVQTGP